jgi:hypothetical protein
VEHRGGLRSARNTLEAFGGWELEEILEMVQLMHAKNPLQQTFILDESAFAKVHQAQPPLE